MRGRSELVRLLADAGAVHLRNGSKHQIWMHAGEIVIVPYGSVRDRGGARAKLATRLRRS